MSPPRMTPQDVERIEAWLNSPAWEWTAADVRLLLGEVKRQAAARAAIERMASLAGDLWNELCILGHDGSPDEGAHPPYPGDGPGECLACHWANEYISRNRETGARLRELFPDLFPVEGGGVR